MSTPSTIVILEQQSSLQSIRKFVEGTDHVTVVTHSEALAVHALSTMFVSVFICDLTLGQAGIIKLVKIARIASPSVRLLLCGAAIQESAALEFMKDHGFSGGYLVKPFNGISIRNTIHKTLAEYHHQLQHRQTLGRNTEEQLSGPNPNLYEVDSVIGEGGTGTVLLARSRFLGIELAIKVIRPELLDTEEALTAFKNEARITMQLSHRFILRLYNFSAYNESYYIVMEYVRGRHLRDLLLEKGAFSTESVCRILLQCASAISYAHNHNVIHCDLKLENIFSCEDGSLKLLDFGSATLNSRRAQLQEDIVGTPEYMSPEQLRGGFIGPETDQYALAVMTYLMLSGCFPYPADTTADKIIGGYVRPDFSAMPEALAQILRKATAYEPIDRYSSVIEFVDAFVSACGGAALHAVMFEPFEIKGASEV